MLQKLKTKKGKASARGYTLIEMVTVMVILSVIGMVAAFVIFESSRIYARTVPAMDASYKANFALARLKHDIHDLKATSTISSLTATNFTFDDSSNTTISYSLAGTNLKRGTDILVQGVTALAFAYWKADGSTASVASDLHLVEVDLTVQTGTEPYRLQTAIFPRVLSP